MNVINRCRAEANRIGRRRCPAGQRPPKHVVFFDQHPLQDRTEVGPLQQTRHQIPRRLIDPIVGEERVEVTPGGLRFPLTKQSGQTIEEPGDEWLHQIGLAAAPEPACRGQRQVQ